MFAVKAAAFVLAPNMLGLYGACALQSLSFALLIPASVRYVNLYIAPADCAKGQALIAGMTSLGSIFASFVGGMLYDMTSVKITPLVGFAARRRRRSVPDRHGARITRKNMPPSV